MVKSWEQVFLDDIKLFGCKWYDTAISVLDINQDHTDRVYLLVEWLLAFTRHLVTGLWTLGRNELSSHYFKRVDHATHLLKSARVCDKHFVRDQCTEQLFTQVIFLCSLHY